MVSLKEQKYSHNTPKLYLFSEIKNNFAEEDTSDSELGDLSRDVSRDETTVRRRKSTRLSRKGVLH